MKIRTAEKPDIPRLLELLEEIRRYHTDARPDVFRNDSTKYNAENLAAMLKNPAASMFVAEEKGEVLGYAMCQLKENAEHSTLLPYKMLYLDDLCVDEKGRGQGVGGELLEYCKAYAKEQGCSRIELNVWEFPGSALNFYERHGFQTQRRELEFWL